jgi:hypothetical protein
VEIAEGVLSVPPTNACHAGSPLRQRKSDATNVSTIVDAYNGFGGVRQDATKTRPNGRKRLLER